MSTSNDITTTSTQEAYLTTLQRLGYVYIPSLLPPHLLLASQATSKYVVERARAGKWPYVRTVPKQYPPWPVVDAHSDADIWGVQHLLHPEMNVRDFFAELYLSDPVLDVVKQLLNAGDDELVMELFNLLVSPARDGFELCWHRDDVRADVSVDEEGRLLALKSPGGKQVHAQYNIALSDDRSLVVVPGSHRRVRTDEERDAGPYDELAGQVVVSMKAGDAVFYDSNILHHGVYEGIKDGGLGRMTLHGSVGLAGHGTERARQVLQHGVGEWVDRADFHMEGERGQRAEAMRRRLMEMGSGDGLGFSLEG